MGTEIDHMWTLECSLWGYATLKAFKNIKGYEGVGWVTNGEMSM